MCFLVMIPKKDLTLAIDAALRARGLRLTRQRRIILDVVRATDAHPPAAVVYRRVRRRLPRVSLATVYRNLRTLAAEGFLAERADASGTRFDGNTAAHDHFTCITCGRIYDVPVRAGGAARPRVLSRTGVEVVSQRTEFYGRCGACRRHGGRFPMRGQRRS
jgi:Fur family peroxide stress response transcriptional regulator